MRELSVAVEQAWRMTNAAKGETTKVVRIERAVTQADYEETVAAAKRLPAKIRTDRGSCIVSG